MPPASQSIEFEAYFAEGVVGIYKISREGGEPGRVLGHVCELNEMSRLWEA